MKNNDINIAKLIKRKRLEKGLTLETVAKKVGVGKSTVSKWERGAIQNMKKDKLDALSLILDIDPLVFIYGTEEILNNTNENKPLTRKEFSNAVLNLMNKLDDLTEQEKAILELTLNLISSNKN